MYTYCIHIINKYNLTINYNILSMYVSMYYDHKSYVPQVIITLYYLQIFIYNKL